MLSKNAAVLFQSALVAGNKGKEETVGLSEDGSGNIMLKLGCKPLTSTSPADTGIIACHKNTCRKTDASPENTEFLHRNINNESRHGNNSSWRHCICIQEPRALRGPRCRPTYEPDTSCFLEGGYGWGGHFRCDVDRIDMPSECLKAQTRSHLKTHFTWPVFPSITKNWCRNHDKIRGRAPSMAHLLKCWPHSISSTADP